MCPICMATLGAAALAKLSAGAGTVLAADKVRTTLVKRAREERKERA